MGTISLKDEERKGRKQQRDISIIPPFLTIKASLKVTNMKLNGSVKKIGRTSVHHVCSDLPMGRKIKAGDNAMVNW